MILLLFISWNQEITLNWIFIADLQVIFWLYLIARQFKKRVGREATIKISQKTYLPDHLPSSQNILQAPSSDQSMEKICFFCPPSWLSCISGTKISICSLLARCSNQNHSLVVPQISPPRGRAFVFQPISSSVDDKFPERFRLLCVAKYSLLYIQNIFKKHWNIISTSHIKLAWIILTITKISCLAISTRIITILCYDFLWNKTYLKEHFTLILNFQN